MAPRLTLPLRTLCAGTAVLVVIIVLQGVVLALPIVSVPLAALAGAALLSGLAWGWAEPGTLVAAAGVAVFGVLIAMAALSVRGVPVLASTYLLGWVATTVVSVGVAVGAAWVVGHLGEERAGAGGRGRRF